MRKVFATIVGAGVFLLFSAVPALAWHGNASGSAECTEQGVLFTFAVDSWDAQHPGTVVTRLDTRTTPATFQETLPFGTSSDSLDWKMTWPDSQEKDSGTVHAYFEGACQRPPDVSVAKVADTETIDAGDTAGFTITVTNNGPGDAQGVSLTDAFPGGVNWSLNQVTGGWTCKINAGVLACGGPGFTLAAQTSASVHVFGTTDASDCGVLSNTASVTASNEAANADANNSATATITVRCASIHITKSSDQGTVTAGDEVGFTIVVTNNGDGIAHGVAVTDTLPSDPGLSWSIDAAGSDTGCSIGAGDLTCNFGSLASGASKHVHITSPTTAATCGVVDNSASVTTSNDGADSDDASITIDCPKIDIEKKADVATVDAGEQIGFRIEVTNNGIGTAKDVVVTDTLPTNDGLDWSIAGGSGAQLCAIASGVLTCDFGDMGAAAEYKVRVTSDTDATTCGTVDNTATVTVSNGNGDRDGASVVVNCPPIGIDIQKDGPDLAHVGDTITYTFSVTLTQDEPLFNVTVSDPKCNEGAPVYVSGDDGDVILEPGEVWTYSCTRLVTVSDGDPLLNTATVQGTADDGRPTTDSDDHTVDVIHPGIQIVKTVDPKSGNPGDSVTYTYVVTNTGDTTLFDISVDDDVIGHIGDVAKLPPGQSVTLTEDFVLPAGDPEVMNVGTATGTDTLGEQVSDDDDAFVTIVEAENPPPSSPPTAFTGSDATRLGLIASVLMALGLLGLVLGRRRRPV